MHPILGFLIVVGALFAVGFVLYLPFLLWFRRRRRLGKAVGGEVHFSAAGWVFIAAMLAAMAAAPLAGVFAPDSWFAMHTRGDLGFFRWTICVFVFTNVLESALMRTGWLRLLKRRPPRQGSAAEGAAPPAKWTRRPWKVATLRGVPIFVQASLPTGGVLVALFTDSGLVESVAYCVAFMALIGVHELGHFVAARALGLRVFAVHISGAGGSCLTQFTRGTRDTFLLYSGGLLAQALLLVLTLIAVALLGSPSQGVAHCVVVTFTTVNLIVAVINLVPGKVRDDLSNDGAILWELLLHVTRGAPHPLAKQHAASPLFPRETNLTAIADMLPPGFQVGVEMLNDDSTTMEFVMAVLQKYLALDAEAAKAAMLRIHAQGGMLFALADRAQADAVADGITREARAQGHVLVCRAVEAAVA
jgi:ATP-dependent Clp protease adapter protein ClpS